jgi:hypothetical protein
MSFRDDYKVRVRRRRDNFVAAPELNAEDLSLLFRALGAYEDQLDSEMLSAPSDTDLDQLRAEKKDAKELAVWLQNGSDELWRYNDADAWTTCEECGEMNIPIVEMGAPEHCDDCAAYLGEE